MRTTRRSDDQVQTQRELDVLAEALHLSVSLDLPDGTLAAYSTGPADVDPARIEAILRRRVPREVLDYQLAREVHRATTPVRVPANARLGMSSRTCLPVRRDGELVAYLWVLDQGRDLDPRQLAALSECAHRLSGLLPGAATAPHAFLAQLFGAEPDALQVGHGLRAALDGTGASRLRFTVYAPTDAVRGERAPARDPAAPPVRRTSDELGRCWVDGRLLVLTGVSGRETHASLPTAGPTDGERAVTGRSDDVAAAASRSEAGLATDALREAARAIVAADCAAVDPALPARVHWRDLGAYRRLLATGEPEAWPETPASLAALAGSPMLEHTLEAYLDTAGDAARTTARLGIHRTTFYYRLERLAEHGIRLDDSLARIDHHLALKSRRLAQARDHFAWTPGLLRRLDASAT